MIDFGWKRLAISGALAGLSGCFCSCVARGSRVWTPSGWRLIEELRVGDIVLSYDPISGESFEGPVTMTRAAKRETILVRIGDAELAMTSDHPVYGPDEGVFANAGDWALGRRTRRWLLHEGRPVVTEVTSASIDGGVREVFDITVETAHHNFIAEGVLVHNKSPPSVECTYEGRTVYEWDSCVCSEGQAGWFVCDYEGGTATCQNCEPVDAGLDAAPPIIDAGSDAAMDAPMDDAAIQDAAAEEASVPDAASDDAASTDAGS